ncbi:hypothetical protein GBF38_000026 [Nibea albiflora]|nr:hypothetical protein GBF38_000026 [Nibea albiflora]
MLRQVTRLTDFIKPSTPTTETRTRIHNNTTQWMHNTLTILQQHYITTIASTDTHHHNPTALQIAIGWAKKRYGHRLTEHTISTAIEILQPPATSTTTNPEPTQDTYTTRSKLPTITEEPEDTYPPLPRASAPHKLHLYLGKRTSITEEIKLHAPSTHRQQQTVEKGPTPKQDPAKPQTTSSPPQPTPQTSTSSTQTNLIRTGPIRPPTTLTKPSSIKKQHSYGQDRHTSATPTPPKPRRVTWGKLPNKDNPETPTQDLPVSPIPYPTGRKLTSTSPRKRTVKITAQIHHKAHQPQESPEPQPSNKFNVNKYSNVSVHLSDTIFSLSPTIEVRAFHPMFKYFKVQSTQRSGAQNGSSHTLTPTHTSSHTQTTLRQTAPVPLMSIQTQHIIHPAPNIIPDSETRHTSKQYFKLLQAIHHKQIMDTALTTGIFPPGMLRQVTRLTDFIKPSTPTTETRTRIHNNTTQWMHNTLTILQQHYITTIASTDTHHHNPTALQIAIGWAKKRYGHRLTEHTISTAIEILQPPATSTTTNPEPTQDTYTTRSKLPTITEEPEDTYPPLPRASAPHKLHLYLGKRTSITEEIKLHAPSTHRQQQTVEKGPTPKQDPAKPQTTSSPPQPTPQTSTSSTQTNLIRTGPIRPPTTLTKPSSIKKQHSYGQDRHTSATPTPPKPRRVTWGKLPNKDNPETPTQDLPVSPIPYPTGRKLTSTSPRKRTVKITAQIHHKAHQPQESPEPQPSNKFNVNKYSNVSVHLSDTIFSLSPTIDTGAEGDDRVEQLTPTNQAISMMTGSRKVHIDQNRTHSEPFNNTRLPPTEHTLLDLCPLSTSSPITPDQFFPPLPLPLPLFPFLPHRRKSWLRRPPCPPFPNPTATLRQPPLLHHRTHPPSTRISLPPPTSLQPGHHSPPTVGQQNTSTATSPTIPLISTQNKTTTVYRPTYHLARPNRKIQDWFFKSRKPIIILGDSNINRIPAHHYPQIQLDSYPGANAYHFLKICEKTLPQPQAKVVIFSIGINNKDQDPRQTTIKQLKALFRIGKSTFPNADIYFPIMNFSPNLTTTQRNNLTLINNTMATHFPILTEIPHDTFHTEKDNIHWTPTTAKAIFHNWCRFLNLP